MGLLDKMSVLLFSLLKKNFIQSFLIHPSRVLMDGGEILVLLASLAEG